MRYRDAGHERFPVIVAIPLTKPVILHTVSVKVAVSVKEGLGLLKFQAQEEKEVRIRAQVHQQEVGEEDAGAAGRHIHRLEEAVFIQDARAVRKEAEIEGLWEKVVCVRPGEGI